MYSLFYAAEQVRLGDWLCTQFGCKGTNFFAHMQIKKSKIAQKVTKNLYMSEKSSNFAAGNVKSELSIRAGNVQNA